MSRIKAMFPYLLTPGIGFYVLPNLMIDTGSAIFVLLICLPLITFVCALIYGTKYPFEWKCATMIAILFAPTIYIFYNSSAAIYIVIFFGIALVGNAVGRLLSK